MFAKPLLSKPLLSKSLLAVAALAASFAITLPAAPAKADVDVEIGIGTGYGGGYGGGGYGGGYGGGGYGGGYGGGGYGGGWGGGYYPPRPVTGIYVDCNGGRRILSRYGYIGIRMLECRGPVYRYSAWKNGRQYLMRVDARGDVSRIRRIH
ncbi:hypothetical protein [Aestuariivirga sp.]|uniref:hypothetical protein n=1 Tax=Aestuariivirga sp. TaxID=2650926 RepID=UPI003BA99D75